MKKRPLFILAGILFFLSSCIKDEPLNPEADILSFSLPDSAMLISSRIGNNDINVFVTDGSKIDAISPIITITPGATISPAPDEARDFTTPQTYTVYSEDGENSKTYTVNFIFSLPTYYDFENWILKKTIFPGREYYALLDANGNSIWASGNSGIAMYMNPPYPTTKTTVPSEVYAGESAAKMVTMKGPGNVLSLYIPIVAGSLFIGEFKLDAAKPVRSPKFGLPFSGLIPTKFSGVYKYKQGKGDYINSAGEIVPNMNDSCTLYSILYEDKGEPLNGESVFTSDDIVAFAEVPKNHGTPGDNFIPFDIPYQYPKGKEAIDFENKQYNFAVVLSSSFRGDYYEGKVGSTLIVDEIRITTEPGK